ncbi:hypothetical protein E2562_000666 [Oryza meyeriana var. granulata]|uniref:Uncharacterized protein n=1 Tax=Oryza meyeriana var. granulata TaxID=110450 RepID=A0A6G1DU98_9ORYZ|nr:hypothetical protein E2562_000666 [Oryza meyeriana var. granulata]
MFNQNEREEDKPKTSFRSYVRYALSLIASDKIRALRLLFTAVYPPAFDDVEAAAAPGHAGGGAGQQSDQDQEAADEAKRVSKSVQTVSLFAASASLVMFFNLPGKQPAAPWRRAALYSVTLAFICLGLFTSLGLSMFSIVARPGADAAVARVQKRAMVMAVAFVLFSFTLRMCMTLPGVFVLIFFLLAGAGGAGLYLSLVAQKLSGGRSQNDDDEAGAAVQLTSTEPT